MKSIFNKSARAVCVVLGSPIAFFLAVLLVIVWALCGPFFGFSETWQLVINTTTTIITFLMVFLIQNTQNRDSMAMQVKLDELLRAVSAARNKLIDIENLSEEELEKYLGEFKRLQKKTLRVTKNASEGSEE